MVKKKAKGVVLLEAFLALLLMAMASYGLAAVNSVQFSQLAASTDATQAKNYAELEAQYLKQLGYEAVVDDNRDDDEPSRTPRYPAGKSSSDDKASNARNMTKFLGNTEGAKWKSTATLGETITNIGGDPDNKIQNVVVSVYKTSDGTSAIPRATITVPLSTQGSVKGVTPVGGVIIWPKDSDPNTSSIVWLECNGQSYDTNKYKKLYKALGSNKVPNFQGMFLRGSGSQSFSQDNGSLSSSSTTYSAGTIGSIQGDGMRRLYGMTGPVMYTAAGGAMTVIDGNFVLMQYVTDYPAYAKYELGRGSSDPRFQHYISIPYTEYRLSGSPDSGYWLSSTTRNIDYDTLPYDANGWQGHTIGWDSSKGAPTANEIRPVNMAVKYYIRAK
ncbi:MAG: tail fiber protein [Selenomonas sp.]|nr:tail fiber protein [Selenomonas sp.]